MRVLPNLFITLFLLSIASLQAQEQEQETQREPGHYNQNKFKQLYQEFSTPNLYRFCFGGARACLLPATS